MKKNYLWIFVILVVSFGLRLIALDQSLWLDEGIEWWGVTAFDLKKLLTGYMLGDFNPPGHHILMWFWVRIFGDSEIALRMPSVLFGVGTVAMVYAIAKATSDKPSSRAQVFDSEVAQTRGAEGRQATSNAEQKASSQGHVLRTVLGVLQGPSFPALLAATNGILIYYSQEARMYAMATFFVTASVWAFLKLQKFFSIQVLTTYYLLLTAALYSHYLTWLMIPVFVIGRFRKIGVVRSIAPIFSTIPLLPLLVKQLQNGIASAGNSQWAVLSQTTPKNVALVFIKFVTGRVPFPERWELQLLVAGLVALFWLGVVRGMREMWGVREQKIIVYWLVVPLVLGGLIGLVVPVFSYFRFLFVLPAAILLFGRGVGGFRGFGGVGVVTFLSFSLLYLFSPVHHRENWKGLVSRIYLGKVEAISSFVIIHPAVQPPFDYYDRGGSRIAGLDSNIPNSLWYIPYGQPIFDPDDSTRKALQQKGYIRTLEQHFQEVTLEKWEKTPTRLPDRPKFLKL